MALGFSLIRFKKLDRFVSVKGLSEREVSADIAVWPLSFASANNDLGALYATMEENAKQIVEFLQEAGFSESEITMAAPVVTDKFAQRYGTQPQASLRYTAQQIVTVYTGRIDAVRALQSRVGKLGKKGHCSGWWLL
nr:SIMPL domain-containing protein [Desulfosoma caldarium]